MIVASVGSSENHRENSAPDHDNPVDKIVLGDAKIIEGALLV
jgi:hypothetical protein